MAWRNVSVKVPAHTAFMDTDDDIRALLQLFGVKATTWSDASLGRSAIGPDWEGDVYDDNGDELLSYDFCTEPNGMAHIYKVFS